MNQDFLNEGRVAGVSSLRIDDADASKSSNYLNKLAKRKEVRLRETTVSAGNI